MHLVSNHSIVALMNVALRVVDDRLHNPLMIECREASRFEEEFCEILIRTIRLCLQICHEKRLFQKLSQEISLIVIESEFNFSRNSGLDCRDGWRCRWSLLWIFPPRLYSAFISSRIIATSHYGTFTFSCSFFLGTQPWNNTNL